MNTKYITLIALLSSTIIQSSEKIPLLAIYEETKSCTTTTSSDELKKILLYNIKQVKKLEQEINNDVLSYTYENSSDDESKTLEELLNTWDNQKFFLQNQQNKLDETSKKWDKKVCCIFKWPGLDTYGLKHHPILSITSNNMMALCFGGLFGILAGIPNLYQQCPLDNSLNQCNISILSPDYLIPGIVTSTVIGNILIARAACLSKKFETQYPNYHRTQEAFKNTKQKIKNLYFNT